MNGVDIRTVAEIMGHRSISQTIKYTHSHRRMERAENTMNSTEIDYGSEAHIEDLIKKAHQIINETSLFEFIDLDTVLSYKFSNNYQ